MKSSQDRIKQFESKQYLVSFIGLLLLMGLSIIANSLHLQSVAEQHTKFISRMIQFNNFREIVLTLEEARLSDFTKIEYQSSIQERSFTLPPKSGINPTRSFIDSLVHDRFTTSVTNSLSSSEPDNITFEYNRFRFVPYGFLIWIVLNLISIPQTRYMKKRLLEQFENDLISKSAIVKSEIAKNVRHNLRTPLAALLRIPAKLPDSAQNEKELLESIIQQIRSLISKLDGQDDGDSISENQSVDLYNSLLKARQEIALTTPDRISFNFDISDDIASAQVTHIPSELRALLGNLVNNSIEAISGRGNVQLTAYDLGNSVKLLVQDTGCGIPEDLISKVFEKGFSHGKIDGTGLGLTHAQDFINSWQGHIGISSNLGRGTNIIITLPIKDRTSWYVPRLKFSDDSQVVILDDQQSARQLWQYRMTEANLNKQVTVLSDLSSFDKIEFKNPQQCTFLFDYDLQSKTNGFELLKKLPPESTRVLVTGHFDEQLLREACIKEKILLLPKSQISEVPLIKI